MTDIATSINKEAQPIKPESKIFLDLCDHLKELHLKKAHDYGNGRDPLGNFSQAKDWGLTPMQGIMIRIGDKIARLQSFMIKNTLLNESVVDTLIDLAAYALLAVVLLRRQDGPK